MLYGQLRSMPAVPQPENTEKYGEVSPNPVHAVAQTSVSTFSADVDTGSYANVRRFLNNNHLPPHNAVRTEELINYFDYAYAQPSNGKPFAVHTEVADSPWQPEAKLIRIGIKAQDITAKQLPPANLVFWVDVSGSMDGDFNVGITDFNALKDLAAEKRKSGVSLMTLGLARAIITSI